MHYIIVYLFGKNLMLVVAVSNMLPSLLQFPDENLLKLSMQNVWFR